MTDTITSIVILLLWTAFCMYASCKTIQSGWRTRKFYLLLGMYVVIATAMTAFLFSV